MMGFDIPIYCGAYYGDRFGVRGVDKGGYESLAYSYSINLLSSTT